MGKLLPRYHAKLGQTLAKNLKGNASFKTSQGRPDTKMHPMPKGQVTVGNALGLELVSISKSILITIS